MSGGHWNHIQHKVDEIVEELYLISQSKNYTRPTLDRIERSAEMLQRANKALDLADSLISGGIGEHIYHERWREEVLKNG